MKHSLLLCLLGTLLGINAAAQPGARHHGPHSTHHSLRFEAAYGESYTVFLDGDIVNRMPQSQVALEELSEETHEVVVVLRRPVQKAAVLHIVPRDPRITINVTYDPRTETLSLYTPSHNLADHNPDLYRPVANPEPRHEGPHDKGHAMPHADKPRPASDYEVAGMVARMNDQSFDSDKLALGKVIVASSHLTAAQIARLAETIDYSSTQVEFLKYAYPYCIDPTNYYKTTDILTFSSDKKKVLDYIATQRL